MLIETVNRLRTLLEKWRLVKLFENMSIETLLFNLLSTLPQHWQLVKLFEKLQYSPCYLTY